MPLLQARAPMLPERVISVLAEEWRAARRAAVERVLGVPLDDGPEDEALRLAAEVDEAELHRLLFEGAVRVGAMGQRAAGRPLDATELPSLVTSLGVSCLEGGAWTTVPGQPGWRYTRKPCSGCADRQLRCDAWRESIDGLVLGLTGHLRPSGQPEPSDASVRVVKEPDPADPGP